VAFSVECVHCGETVDAPELSESTLKDYTTRTVECGGCGAHVEFIYNIEHQPFGARIVAERRESTAD
jgi:endogenous inhibitor of DNA gyrase (YacG/DUF329 family)